MDATRLLKIVEQYSRASIIEDDEVKVKRVPDQKTVFVEESGEYGRSIYLTEFNVDGKTLWAGYSSRSQTVYVSLVTI